MKIKLTQKGEGPDSAFALLIDDIDVTDYVLRDGFTVAIGATGPAVVTMSLIPSSVDIDLPEAVLAAIATGAEA